MDSYVSKLKGLRIHSVKSFKNCPLYRMIREFCCTLNPLSRLGSNPVKIVSPYFSRNKDWPSDVLLRACLLRNYWAKGQFTLHESDRNKYYQCLADGYLEVTCPNGPNWNQGIIGCDQQANAECNLSGCCSVWGQVCYELMHQCIQ